MAEVENIASQIWTGIQWVILKINLVLNYLATFIGEKAQIPIDNIYLFLLAGMSLYIGAKITEERGAKLFIIAAIIFAIVYMGKLGVVA